MKKILIFASIITLSACGIHAGGYKSPISFSIFGQDKSYSIDYFENQGLKAYRTEKIEDIYPSINETQRAYTGFSVFYDKTYTKTYFQDCFVKAKMDGVLSAGSAPSYVYKKDTKRLLGRSYVEDQWYSLLPADDATYVWLIKEDGSIAGKMGKVKDRKLYILDTQFVPSPRELSFEIIKETKMDQTIPTTGFDVKYSGIKLGQVTFTVLDYSKYSKDKGEFEVFYFDNKANMNVNIMGIKIKVLSADEQKIDYIVLGY